MDALVIEEDFLAHYGIQRRSGRYPWGSGGTENTRNRIFLDCVSELRGKGLSDTEIARGYGMSTGEFRAVNSNAKAQQKQANIAMAQRLKDKGYSNAEVARRMKQPPRTVDTWLAPGAADKANITEATANTLKKHVDEKQFLDVGKGTETQIGITNTTMTNAVAMLRAQGYELHQVPAPQAATGHNTNLKILCPPGTTQKEVFLNRDKIQQIQSFSEDHGRTWAGIHPPLQINPKRVGVVYGDQGGREADGMIHVRPGVKDVELGGVAYAQVRVAVGANHYLKGMAIYKDDLPAGTDLLFHTNKKDTGNKLDAFKENSDNADSPFSAVIKRQIVEKKGDKEKVTSAMNIVNEEGSWANWSKNISSQVLSKQKPALAKTQLDVTFEDRKSSFDEINSLTNATVRKRLLIDFADNTDSAAVHLQAKGFPGQATHVILPLKSIKSNEVYAPNYKNGDKVVLIRYPHGGPFEIPELTVNNRNHEGRSVIGPLAKDAIGIHHTVAEHLSGADFDGDFVSVIPNNHRSIEHRPALKELKDFDPKHAYPGYPGMKVMKNTQTEMGKISNLITDMSLRNAPDAELARAVKHSMVVIDAEKHGLNHRLSYNDNNIKQLKEKYQSGGASTLISRKKTEVRIPEIKPRSAGKGGPIDKRTGELVFEPTGKVNTKTGLPRTTKIKELALLKDASPLSSGTPVERLYVAHSNKLKGLANEARRISVNTPHPKQNPSAKKTYAKEVKSLNDQLALAVSNSPKERQAQLIANTQYRLKLDADPNMDPETRKKVKFQTLDEARRRTGSEKTRIVINEREWEAIQAGAISHSKLNQILDNANMEVVKKLATPKTQKLMSSTKTARAKQMLNSGYTRAEVASQLGVSLTTLDTAIA